MGSRRTIHAISRLVLVAALGWSLAEAPSTNAQGRSEEPRTCGDSAVATAPQTPGSPLVSNEVVLTRPDGNPALSVEFQQPASVIPATLEHRTLIRSLGGDFGLLDTESGTVTTIVFPESDPGSVSDRAFMFFESQGTRFHLFGDMTGYQGYLVDLETGDSLMLADLVDEQGPVVSGAVAPSDHWLVFFAGRQNYLLDLAGSGQAEPLDPTHPTRSAAFTSDGGTIVFLRETESRLSEIVARDLDTREERILAPESEWFGVRVFPGNQIVAYREGEVVRVHLDGGDPQSLVKAPGELVPLLSDPDGVRLLVQQRQDDQLTWRLASFDGSGSSEVVELAGMSLLVHQKVAGWALFAVDLAPLQGTPGTPYLSLELATGVVTQPLVQDGDGIYTAGIDSTFDGRYELVQSVSTAQGRLWLLDANAGSAALVGQSTGNVSGRFSPDGCYLAVGTFDAVGEGRQGKVEVIDVQTGTVILSIPDSILLGWAVL